MLVIAVPKKVDQAAKKMSELEEGTTKSSQSVEVSIFKYPSLFKGLYLIKHFITRHLDNISYS